MTAIDTNVLLDIVAGDPSEARAALGLLAAVAPPLVISPAVYTELCAHRGWTPRDVSAFLAQGGIIVTWHMPETTWSAAGEAFARHAERRRRTSAERPRRIATDFIIGAHASALGTLVTRDGGFFQRHFPELRVVGAIES